MTDAFTLQAAYAACRAIAKREAKNFYYAFVALPEERRNAICAIYAFMRKADDLADDESLPHAERRRQLDAWLAEWHVAVQGGPTSDPVFIAVNDAVRRFAIPLSLLDELVAGTTMDVEPAGTEPDTYETFDDLYRYCYLVASVVGLVCIRIFGYSDPAAEKLAEETGIAFQLTNILRDVREDAGLGRVYLPAEDLRRFSVDPAHLEHNQCFIDLMQFEAARARRYYDDSWELLDLVHRRSRPSLWALMCIYSRLLERIERSNYDVLDRRISLPAWEKLTIVGRALAR